MKTLAGLLLAVTFGVGCTSAPEPVDYAELEAMDRRFTRSVGGAAKETLEEILRKEELTLEDALRVADLMNPVLAAERRNIDLAGAAVWEARLYPNPVLLLEFEDYRTKDRATIGKMQRSAGLSVPLVVSGRIGAATAVAEKEREIAAVNYVWRRREILSAVKAAFLGLLGSRRRVELGQETRDLARTFHTVTEDRFRAQAVPEMEVLKSAVALAKAESDLKIAEKDLGVAVKVLQATMGNVEFPKDKFAGELSARFTSPSFEALRGHVVTIHPLLESARNAKEAAELALELARRERIPDLGLDVTAGRDPEDDSIIEAGLSVPLPLFNRNQAHIARAEARIRQAEHELDAVRNELLLRLTEAYRTFAANQERVSTYVDDILPKAEKAYGQTQEGYRLGKHSYLDVLDAQRTLADARSAYVAALADLNLSAVELEKLTGMRLEPIR